MLESELDTEMLRKKPRKGVSSEDEFIGFSIVHFFFTLALNAL